MDSCDQFEMDIDKIDIIIIQQHVPFHHTSYTQQDRRHETLHEAYSVREAYSGNFEKDSLLHLQIEL